MFFTTLLLPLAVSAAVVQERDLSGIMIPADLKIPAAPAAANIVVEKLEPKYRKTAQRAKFKLGPYTLNPGSTMQGQAIFYTMPRTLCNKDGPCTILAGSVGVQFTDGQLATPAQGIYIHHILTSDSTKKQKPWLSNCGSPNSPALNIAGLLGGTAFVGAGEDSAEGGAVYTSDDGTRNSGYHVGAQDSFTGWAQLVNYNKEAKKVYVFYDLEWVPGIHGDDVKTATFTATCGGSPAIKLSQTGPTNTTSGKFYFMEDGKILGARGHLHDGGVKVSMMVNGKFVCASEAIYGVRGEEEKAGGDMAGHSHGGGAGAGGAMAGKQAGKSKGMVRRQAPKGGKGGMPGGMAGMDKDSSGAGIKTISRMTTCRLGPQMVKKGDTMQLVAEYDLKKHPLRSTATGGKAADVMGMMGVSFSATK